MLFLLHVYVHVGTCTPSMRNSVKFLVDIQCTCTIDIQCTCTCTIQVIQCSYITPKRAVSNLQSPTTRVGSAQVGGVCKLNIARVGVI